MNQLLLTAINASILAGKEILEVYNKEFDVDFKDDKSPLTEADLAAHNKIVSIIKDSGIPILSEEGKSIEFNQRSGWDQLWIVDPLDGTKEFIKRNGEFTVNIALVENGFPVLGVIYVPVKNQLYFGSTQIGSYKVNVEDSVESLEALMSDNNKLPFSDDTSPYKVVGSRSHMSSETEEFIDDLRKEHQEIEIVSMGSSLKICLVAEGAANVYPRFAPTMEWDTAAGQAIAENAGKSLIDYTTKKRMNYNREQLRNNWFLVK